MDDTIRSDAEELALVHIEDNDELGVIARRLLAKLRDGATVPPRMVRGNMGDDWTELECWKRLAIARARIIESHTGGRPLNKGPNWPATAEIVEEVAVARLRALGIDPEGNA